MDGLREAGWQVDYGEDHRLFPALTTCLRHRPDAIHFDWIHRYLVRSREWLSWLTLPLFYLDILLTQLLFPRTKLVFTLHNLVPHDTTAGPWLLRARAFFMRRVALVRVFSPGTIERARQLYPGVPAAKFHAVPEGSYLGWYPAALDVKTAKQRLAIPTDDFVLLYFGGIRPYKGIVELIKAFQAQPITIRLRLMIVGKPYTASYLAEVEAAARVDARIQVVGKFVADDEVSNYLSAADLVVLPFKTVENSGSVILAMGYGKPVVAPRTGVVADRLRQQTELLYEDDLPGALNRAIATDKEKLEGYGEANLTAVQQYAWADFGHYLRQELA